MPAASRSPWRYLPNAISLLRIALVAPIAWLLLARAWMPALGLIALAGISDGIDGFLARRCGWQSRLGGMLDGLADKLLLVACFVLLAWMGVAPPWLAWVVCLRDASIGIAALLWRVLVGPLQPQPSWLSKACTVAQIVYLLDVLVGAAGRPALPSMPLAWLVAALCAASWLDYAWRWSRRAWQASRQR